MNGSTKLMLSICIPTYNRSELLKRTLRSLEDGNPEVEVLIGDNSNNELSHKIVKEKLSIFKGNWTYYKNEPPIDPIKNLNHLIENARGKYVYVLHDDDYLFPGGLNVILQKLAALSNQHVFSFGVKVVDINENVLKVEACGNQKFLTSKAALLNTLNDSSYIRMPSIIISREAYLNVGCWDPQMAPPDDIDMFVRLFFKYPLVKIPDIVAAYTVHEGAWTEKVFNQKTISVLLRIFKKVENESVLQSKELLKAKSNFFHQFILGGTFREIKKRNFKNAKQILLLFTLEEISNLKIPIKWIPVRFIFSISVGIGLFFKGKFTNPNLLLR